MKKLLCFLLALLCFSLPAFGCNGQAKKGGAPLVIEQGSIKVASMWKNNYRPQNSCPNDVAGEPLVL